MRFYRTIAQLLYQFFPRVDAARNKRIDIHIDLMQQLITISARLLNFPLGQGGLFLCWAIASRLAGELPKFR